jgi:hypothetical protein
MGEIPSEIGNLLRLKVLHLRYNIISGHIPTELGLLTKLGHLVLNNNILLGSIFNRSYEFKVITSLISSWKIINRKNSDCYWYARNHG